MLVLVTSMQKERLPDIFVSPPTKVYDFLKQVESLVIPGYAISRRSDCIGEDVEILEFHPQVLSKHKGLFGQLTASPFHGRRAQIEVRAQRWLDAYYPSYDTYVAAARAMFGPVISTYRKRYGMACPIRIQSKRALEPRLPERTKYFFDQFVASANKQGLHALDWKRFYHFVWAAHHGRINANEEDIGLLLLKSGFSEEMSNSLADLYLHGRQFYANRIMLAYMYPPQYRDA